MSKFTILPLVIFFIFSSVSAGIIYFPNKNPREQVIEKKRELNESDKTLQLFSIYPFSLKNEVLKINQSPVFQKNQGISKKEYKQLKGGKLSLKEKIFFLLMKRHLHKERDASKQGQNALIFGIIGLGLLVIGIWVSFLLVGSLIASIIAIVMGSAAQKKNPKDSKAGTGKLLGWITLILLALLVILAAIIIASFLSGSWWA